MHDNQSLIIQFFISQNKNSVFFIVLIFFFKFLNAKAFLTYKQIFDGSVYCTNLWKMHICIYIYTIIMFCQHRTNLKLNVTRFLSLFFSESQLERPRNEMLIIYKYHHKSSAFKPSGPEPTWTPHSPCHSCLSTNGLDPTSRPNPRFLSTTVTGAHVILWLVLNIIGNQSHWCFLDNHQIMSGWWWLEPDRLNIFFYFLFFLLSE